MPSASLSKNEVLDELRRLVRRGKIAWTTHAEERLAQRGFDRSQVKDCLLLGFFTEPPTIPIRSGPIGYKFTMKAHIDGDAIAVAACLYPEKNVVVISVIDVSN
ncbi:DUF4258 domain-containing protein [Thiobacillus denitrificans]|uniref:DUF4258 domain-containing protein n=1 Tax=Thiobacillus denitrificans TaxID=36861 RepID=UPI0009E8B8C3|nr:DUF4258 domain-containing protein [Thiobacillus denitrificans]